MSTLSDLKAALEAKREAEREWEKYADVLVPSEESRHAALIVGRARNRMVGILADDTIAALIAVAEAADVVARTYPDLLIQGNEGSDFLEALAPLLKEVPDERA